MATPTRRPPDEVEYTTILHTTAYYCTRRPPDEVEYLQRLGSRVHVIGLQGYLFEGTAVRLVSRE